MSRTDLAWLAVAAYALHIMEERILDWLGSARKSQHIQLEQENYRLVEAVFLILGAVAAILSVTLPLLALSFAAFLLINALYFHLWPVARSGGQYSPGVITAFFLFLPIVYLQYKAIATQPMDYALSVIIGGAVIFSPLVLMKMREHLATGGGAGGGSSSASRRGRRK